MLLDSDERHENLIDGPPSRSMVGIFCIVAGFALGVITDFAVIQHVKEPTHYSEMHRQAEVKADIVLSP